MTDIDERLRAAIAASVEDAFPSRDLITAVRERHRKRRLREMAMSLAAVMAVVAAAVFFGLRISQAAPPRPPAASATPAGNSEPPLFPGGGRLLLAYFGTLRWLYPNGRTVAIPGSFNSATVAAGELLAWRSTGYRPGYYTMGLDGSGQHRVLPEGSSKLSVIQALLSPDGSRLAFLRQDLISQVKVVDTLWVLDLATGKQKNLGPVSTSAFGWQGDSTILSEATDGKTLLHVDAISGVRSAYLSVFDPALISAYERAQPGAGPPAYIGSDGVTGGVPANIAVWLGAASAHPAGGSFPQFSAFTRPAEVVLASGKPVVSYAPRTREVLSLTFGPDGLVLLETGAGDNPNSWRAYSGSVRSPRLSKPVPYGGNGAIFNPAGNVIALQDDGGLVTFTATPRPFCDQAPRCLTFQLTHLLQPGTVQAWMP
jgi:hypothetical protein